MSTIPSKRIVLASFWEYFKSFVRIVLTGLYRDLAASFMERNILSKTVLGKRGSIALDFTLAVCQVWSDFFRKLPDPSSAILCLAEMSLCSLNDSTTSEQLLLMAPITLIKFCFLLFWQFIIILVDYIVIWILVLLVSEDRNIIARGLFSGWLDQVFLSMWLTSFSSAVTIDEIYFWLRTKRTTFVNNDNEKKTSMCNENPC